MIDQTSVKEQAVQRSIAAPTISAIMKPLVRGLVGACALIAAPVSAAAQQPPRNPWLADST